MEDVLTGWLLEEFLCVVLALFLRFFVGMLVRVKGRSMEPTLHDRDILLVTHYDRWTRPPQRFDVVICRYPGRRGYFVKRIVGLPGDTLCIADGLLTVNGETFPESYLIGPLMRRQIRGRVRRVLFPFSARRKVH